MTSLVALVLTTIALIVILTPVFRRRAGDDLVGSSATLREWQDRYRGSLADLQDAELDWQVGNFSDEDYQTVRAEQRRRAAEALREATIRENILAQVRSEIGLEPRGGAASGTNVPARLAPATVVGTPERRATPARRLPAATPVLAGAVVAVGAVAGVALLYFRLLNAQAAQQPLAALPIEHAHTAVVDASGFWVGHHDGLLRSVDGARWQRSPATGDVMALVTLDGRRFLFGHDVLLTSADGGETWAPLAHDLPGTDVHGAQLQGDRIYAYVVDFGAFRSPDGSRWEQVGPPLGEDVGGLAVLPGSAGGDLLYLDAGGVLARSADGGRTWSSANGAGNGAISGFVNAVSADARNGLLYAGTSQGLFRSSTGGADWARLPFRGAVTAVGAEGGRVAVVDEGGRFYLSTDGGGTWTANP